MLSREGHTGECKGDYWRCPCLKTMTDQQNSSFGIVLEESSRSGEAIPDIDVLKETLEEYCKTMKPLLRYLIRSVCVLSFCCRPLKLWMRALPLLNLFGFPCFLILTGLYISGLKFYDCNSKSRSFVIQEIRMSLDSESLETS